MSLFNEKNFSLINLLSNIVLIFLIMLSLAYFLLTRQNIYYENELEQFRHNYINTRRTTIKENVLLTSSRINNSMKVEIKFVKRMLHIQFSEVFSVIDGLYNKYKNKMSEAEIKQLIKDTICSYNSDNQSLFIIDTKGKCEVWQSDKQLNGKNGFEFSNEVKNIFLEMIDTSKSKKTSGYVDYYRSNTSEKPGQKISYVKSFGHFDWIIGMEISFDSIIDSVKNRVLAEMRGLRENGACIINYDQVTLVNPLDPKLDNKRFMENRKGLFQSIIKNAERIDGGYIGTASNNSLFYDISYVKSIKNWRWIILSGFHLHDINSHVEEKKRLLSKEMDNEIGYVIIIFVVFSLMAIGLSTIFSSSINRIFLQYKASERHKAEELENLNNSLMIEIAEKKITEDQLIQAKERAELASKTKSDFVANISHELRTPLNAIIGFSELLKDNMIGKLNEKQVQLCTRIHQSGNHLLELINSILDLSKIEAGKINIKFSKVDIALLVESSLNMVESKAKKKNIKLEFSFEDEIGNFFGDETRLKQVLVNLLSNSVKFTPDGGIVSLKVLTKTLSKLFDSKYITEKFLVITIKDTGVGIPKADLNKVFEPFEQLDSSFSKKYEGTGLGLAIVKKIIELHKGTIELKSEEGKGSRFKISIPFNLNLDETSGESKV